MLMGLLVAKSAEASNSFRPSMNRSITTNSRFFAILCAALLIFPATTPARAQSSAQDYDVSIAHRSKVESDAQMVADIGPDAIRIRGLTLEKILCTLYDLHPASIQAPAWVREVRWDIDGKISDYDEGLDRKTTDKERQRRAQLLIEKLFALKYHYVKKIGDIYWLVVDKKGIKLKVDALDPDAPENRGKVGVWSSSGGRLTGWGMSTHDIAEELSEYTDRPILDRTELGARYDIRLRWLNPEDSDGSLPYLPEALKEQAGLALMRSKGEVKKFIIDGAVEPQN